MFFGYSNTYQSPVFAYQNTLIPCANVRVTQKAEWKRKRDLCGSGAGLGLQSKIMNSKSQLTHIQKHQFVSPPVTLEHNPLITSLTSLWYLFASTKPSIVLFWSKDNTTSQTKRKSFVFCDHSSIYKFRHPLDVSSRFNTILNELLNSYSVLFHKSCKSLSSLRGASQGKRDIPVRRRSEVAVSDMTHREQALCFNILLWHSNTFQWPHKAFRHRGGKSVNHWWLHNKAAQVSQAWQVTGDLFSAPFRIILLQLHFLLAETWQIWQRDEKWILLDWLWRMPWICCLSLVSNENWLLCDSCLLVKGQRFRDSETEPLEDQQG